MGPLSQGRQVWHCVGREVGKDVGTGLGASRLDQHLKLGAKRIQEQVIIGAAASLAEEDCGGVRCRFDPPINRDRRAGKVERSATCRHSDETCAAKAEGLIHNAGDEIDRTAG